MLAGISVESSKRLGGLVRALERDEAGAGAAVRFGGGVAASLSEVGSVRCRRTWRTRAPRLWHPRRSIGFDRRRWS